MIEGARFPFKYRTAEEPPRRRMSGVRVQAWRGKSNCSMPSLKERHTDKHSSTGHTPMLVRLCCHIKVSWFRIASESMCPARLRLGSGTCGRMGRQVSPHAPVMAECWEPNT